MPAFIEESGSGQAVTDKSIGVNWGVGSIEASHWLSCAGVSLADLCGSPIGWTVAGGRGG